MTDTLRELAKALHPAGRGPWVEAVDTFTNTDTVLDRVFPPHQCDDTWADEYVRLLGPAGGDA